MIRVLPAAAQAINGHAVESADGNETGGILLGHDLGDTLVVTVAGGPGPNAVRTPYRFNRDLAYSQALADDAYARDGSVWIGEWHTHPKGQASPSQVDLSTYLAHLATPDLGFTRFLSFIALPCPAHGWSEVNIVPWLIEPSSATVVPLRIELEER
jgi:integrative and conjugative element protein (TIGR02256 family)